MPYIILSGCLLLSLFIVRAALGVPNPRPGLEIAFAQFIGQRQINADAFTWSVKRGMTLFALADGIGTGARGRIAALTASDSVSRAFDAQAQLVNPTFFFKQAFRSANEAVWTQIPDETAGASLLTVLTDGRLLYYALAGNCRVAVFRKKTFIPLSEGQTLDVLARNAFKRGEIRLEDAREASKERRIYNYVGKTDFKEPEMPEAPSALKRGDYLIFMTDGVYDFCPQGDMEKILEQGGTCRWKADAIIDILKQAGDPNQDNATVIISRVNRIL